MRRLVPNRECALPGEPARRSRCDSNFSMAGNTCRSSKSNESESKLIIKDQVSLTVCANGMFSVVIDVSSSVVRRIELVSVPSFVQNLPLSGFESAFFASIKSRGQAHRPGLELPPSPCRNPKKPTRGKRSGGKGKTQNRRRLANSQKVMGYRKSHM